LDTNDSGEWRLVLRHPLPCTGTSLGTQKEQETWDTNDSGDPGYGTLYHEPAQSRQRQDRRVWRSGLRLFFSSTSTVLSVLEMGVLGPGPKLFFVNLVGGLECVDHSFAYAAHL
jgi:hypothetical protein